MPPKSNAEQPAADRSVAWFQLALNPGWAETIIANVAGDEIPIPPDLPSRIRLVPLLRKLDGATPEQLQAAADFAAEFLRRTTGSTDSNRG